MSLGYVNVEKSESEWAFNQVPGFLVYKTIL